MTSRWCPCPLAPCRCVHRKTETLPLPRPLLGRDAALGCSYDAHCSSRDVDFVERGAGFEARDVNSVKYDADSVARDVDSVARDVDFAALDADSAARDADSAPCCADDVCRAVSCVDC